MKSLSSAERGRFARKRSRGLPCRRDAHPHRQGRGTGGSVSLWINFL